MMIQIFFYPIVQNIECKKKDNCVTVQIYAAEPDDWFIVYQL